MEISLERQLIFLPSKIQLAVIQFVKDKFDLSSLSTNLYWTVYDTYQEGFVLDKVQIFSYSAEFCFADYVLNCQR
jgi:hypothetical protein